jgi:hypothetical protein
MRRLLAPVLVALVVAPAGVAATFSFTVTTTSPVTAPTVTLNGDDQTSSFPIVSQVSYTGTNPLSGWKVQASATTLLAATRSLPAMRVTSATYACVTACLASPSPTGITYPITLTSTAQTIYNASAGTGIGVYNVTGTFQISYPANAIPARYSATVTLTGATGP